MADNADQSIYAFERFFEDSRLVFVFNMTPNFYGEYELGVNEPGIYEEIFNSDKDVYGGCNQYNGLPIASSEFGPLNHPHKIKIKIASFGACIFKYRKIK
jgi:1,4-alpha-glucan branching enzyme